MAVTGVGAPDSRLSLAAASARAAAAQRTAKAAAAQQAARAGGAPDGVGRLPATEEAAKAPGAPGAGGFGEALVDAIDAVNADVQHGDDLVQKVIRGEDVETHQLMMALEKADLSVRLMTQVGRRAVEAYREIMRMNV